MGILIRLANTCLVFLRHIKSINFLNAAYNLYWRTPVCGAKFLYIPLHILNTTLAISVSRLTSVRRRRLIDHPLVARRRVLTVIY
ncbi:MAG: hypothetical protein K2K47_06230, partial [Duncaniella sp.]|nr:hypothetical protein [Duncaniella sp.]